MRSLLIVLFVAVLQAAVALPVAEKVRFDNYTVYRVTPYSNNGIKTLLDWQENLKFDFWTSVRAIGVPVDIMIPPHYKRTFNSLLQTEDMSYTVLIDNVQEKIDGEGLRPESAAGTFDLKHYHTLDEVRKVTIIWIVIFSCI